MKYIALQRTVGEQKLVESRWHELGSEELDYPELKSIYSPGNLLEYLLHPLEDNDDGDNKDVNGEASIWDQARVSLSTKDMSELREMFASCNYLGNALPHDFLSPLECERYEREELGNMIFETNDVIAAREFLKSGCPHSLRRHFWSLVLGIEAAEKVQEEFEKLKKRAIKYEFFIDQIMFKDNCSTVCNDEEYFVFQDIVCEIIVAFIRDTYVAKRCNNGGKGTNSAASVAACAIVPFYGFAMYVGPLCFMYTDVPELYAVFREMYCRYFHKLSSISSHPQSILSLMLTFERLLQCREPDLLAALASKNITLLPAAIKLLMGCFTGSLPVEEVFEVWDRILAYDSLHIIPVLAAAIIYSTREAIMKVENQTALEDLISGLSCTGGPVVPMLLKFLDIEHQ
ncbi:TBC1 domain family member 19-like [Ornithodoros turicata]|uniref:TBC1 domain family member 19-like n=1 Tax=Ornithodoros turicata TaxID=34597 RepID=UPI00313961D0